MVQKEKIKIFVFMLSLFIVASLLINFVSAAEIAYIYNKNFNIDNAILGVFEELNLSYELISITNVKKTDFSKFKLIYIGDEKLQGARDIPLDKNPTIVANYYHGQLWGLTDAEGISSLGSTDPLMVRINGGVVPVYTQTYFDTKRVSIPYYYLANNNKAQGMTKVAGTYTGNDIDLGDVISYAEPGLKLYSGKTTQERICFFGIINAEYWTDDARQMFLDCVNYVAISCTNDADCDDENDYTYDYCVNPGTIKSECRHEEIKCIKDSDCGTNGFKGEGFCLNGDVYKKFYNFSCLNPYTTSAVCTNNSVDTLFEDCLFGCENGSCKPGVHDVRIENIADSINKIKIISDNKPVLGDLASGGKYKIYFETKNIGNFTENITFLASSDCFSWTPLERKDLEPGKTTQRTSPEFTFNCKGKSNITIRAILEGDDNVLDNIALREINVLEVTCVYDSDCGASGFIGNNFCSGKDVYKNYLEFKCINPGQVTSKCENSTIAKKTENCSYKCENGLCIDAPPINCKNNLDCDDSNSYTFDECNNPGTYESYCTNTLMNCITNNDCGITGFLGSEYCVGNEILKNFRNSTCINPATKQSSCSVSEKPRIVLDCGKDYCEEYTETYCKDNNVYMSRKCYDKQCSNALCLSNAYVEEKLVSVCNGSCTDGKCSFSSVQCSSNSECGTNGFIGEKYCIGKKVYQNYKEYSCNYPGTIFSFCKEDIKQILKQECFEGCLNGKCLNVICTQDSDCDDSNNKTDDECINPGTEDSYCEHKPITCFSDNECGNDAFTQNKFCGTTTSTKDNVYQKFIDYRCENKGTKESACTYQITKPIIESCTDYYSEYSDPYCEGKSLYKIRYFNDLRCSKGKCIKSTTPQKVLLEKCSESCEC